jgi:hypothetical protein
VLRRVSLLLVLLLAVSLVPAATGGTQAKKFEFTILSRMQVTQPFDIDPKGRENRGDYIKYKALLLTTGPLFGKQKKNQPVGWEQGTQTYLNATDARVRGKTTFPGQGTITYRGMMKSLRNGMISVPITGGTGRFTGAQGVLLIGPGDVSSLNTYRLSLPGAGIA